MLFCFSAPPFPTSKVFPHTFSCDISTGTLHPSVYSGDGQRSDAYVEVLPNSTNASAYFAWFSPQQEQMQASGVQPSLAASPGAVQVQTCADADSAFLIRDVVHSSCVLRFCIAASETNQ